MSQKISQLPSVIAANIQDTDVMPLVATNITSKTTIANLRTKLGTQPPLGGRTVTDAFTYLTNNAVFNVKDFGAFGDGVANDAPAVNAAINAAAARGGVILFPPTANGYLLTGPINLTAAKTAKGIRLSGYGTGIGSSGAVQIFVKHTGVGFDLTGSSDILFEHLSVNGDSGTIPQTAFLLARDNSGGTAGRHRFNNVRTRGNWSAAAVWSYGSEENDYQSCYFYNEQPSSKAVVLTGSNRTDVTTGGLASSFVTIATGAQSNLIHNFFGGSYWTVAGLLADCFYLESASSINIFGAWALAGIAAAGRSLVYVDATNGTSNWVHITGLHGENVGAGLNQKFGVLFGNEAVRTHIGWSVRDTRITVGAPQRTAVTVGTTNASAAITSAALFTQTDVGAVIIGAGIPTGTRILSVTNASAATMNANATATASPSCEIVFRLVFAPPNITLSNFRAEQNSETLTGGLQFSAAGTSIQDSFIQSNNLVVVTVLDRSVVIGLPAFWAIANRTNSVLIDTLTGVVDVSASIKVAGTKVIGGQQGGWTNQTAVASKADLGATPTVGQIASWARAIDDMLKTHGLIST